MQAERARLLVPAPGRPRPGEAGAGRPGVVDQRSTRRLLAELSGAGASPSLTLAFSLVHQVQRHGEPVAWITRAESTFFPPDAAEGGVDLAALPVIRLPGRRQCLRAAEQLARFRRFRAAGDRSRQVSRPAARGADPSGRTGAGTRDPRAVSDGEGRPPAVAGVARLGPCPCAAHPSRGRPLRCAGSTCSRTSGAVRDGATRCGASDRTACVELPDLPLPPETSSRRDRPVSGARVRGQAARSGME